jgi:hypothetical protein
MRCSIAAAVVLVLAVLVAVGARGGGGGAAGAAAADGSAAAAPAAASRVYVRRCPASRYNTYPPFRSTARDLTAGPLRVVSFLGVFADEEAGNVYRLRRGGPFVLKAAINIIGRRDVTIVVPRSHRRVLSLDYSPGGGPSPRTVAGGRAAVRFEACPWKRRTTTGYAGGWLYSGPWGRCVPMGFRVEGRSRLIHRRVPLGAGRCGQPR